MNEWNWAHTYAYRAAALHTPQTFDELRGIVRRAQRIHVLGTRHSFNDIADSPELVSLESLPTEVRIDASGSSVAVRGQLRYGDLADALNEKGLALRNLASLPHIGLAGAISTATHGSGRANGNLATAVSAIELLTSDGEMVRFSRGTPDFEGAVVGLGALGVITELTLDLEPAYDVRQRVYENLEWDALFANFETITAAGYSTSLFTRWSGPIDQVWVKSRADRDDWASAKDFCGALPAAVQRHPVPGAPPENCTPQRGIPGRWSDRLPHFRMEFTPSVGEEIQSEFFVAFPHAIGALRVLHELGDRIAPELQVTEIRAVAADDLWMSPQYGQETIAIHFTWHRHPAAVEPLIRLIEERLAPFAARPHWGKVFFAEAASLTERYPRMTDFVALAERLDPRGAFRNDWLQRVVFDL